MKVKPVLNLTTALAPRLVRPLLFLALLTFFSAPSRIGFAFPQFLPIVRAAYSVRAGGVIDGKRCGVCHVDPAGGGAVNPYGKDVKTFLKVAGGKAITGEGLHSLDAKDSDGDGFANIDEFRADTLPGDASSHPDKKPELAVKEIAPEGELSPFDIKAALLQKSAQHPIVIHFPIALFVISLLFDVLAVWKKNAGLRSAATYNLIVAALGSLAAVTTGIIAWQWQYGGAELKGNLRLHLIIGITTAGLLFLLWGMRTRLNRIPGRALTRIYWVLSLITLATLALTGHIGGILSGVVQGP